jgi:peroxiredoxin
VHTRSGGAASGEPAVEFSLHDQVDRPTTLTALVAHGPVVLFFYRGHW